jgi:hypothetical protein
MASRLLTLNTMGTTARKLDECSWTVPVALVWMPATAFVLLCFVLYGLFSTNVPCDVEGRVTWMFVASAATGAACVGMAFRGRLLTRAATAALTAIVTSAVTWWIVKMVFARHC